MKDTSRWIVLLEGLVGIIFGLAIILWPIKSLVVATWLIGAFLLIEAVLLIFASFFNRDFFATLFLQGSIYAVFSLLILGNPNISLALLVVFFAIMSIVSGIVQIVSATNYKDKGERVQFTVFSGIISLISGIFLLAFPEITITISQIVFGITLLVFGITNTMQAFKPREHAL